MLWEAKNIGLRKIRGLSESELIEVAKKKMGETYDFAVQLFSDYIKEVDPNKSGGWVKFAVIVGHHHKAPTEDVHRLWQEAMKIYGEDDRGIVHIKMILGTICMMCFELDNRKWIVGLDPDRKAKKKVGEVPEAAQYWLMNSH
jgi:hypothetical protein